MLGQSREIAFESFWHYLSRVELLQSSLKIILCRFFIIFQLNSFLRSESDVTLILFDQIMNRSILKKEKFMAAALLHQISPPRGLRPNRQLHSHLSTKLTLQIDKGTPSLIQKQKSTHSSLPPTFPRILTITQNRRTTMQVTMPEELVEALSKSDFVNITAGNPCSEKSKQAERKKKQAQIQINLLILYI